MSLEKLKKLKIGVLMGGMSNEREVSLKTGAAVLSSLGRLGVEAVEIDGGKDVPSLIEKEKIDLAFLALHGQFGEDGCMQGMLEIMGIPYTGSGVVGSAMAMSKTITKEICVARGINTPENHVYTKSSFTGSADDCKIKAPAVVKPANGGSSIGVTVCKTDQEIAPAIAKALGEDSEALVEEFIDGPLITIGVVGSQVLPAIEIETLKGFYDYESKYTPGNTVYHLPARIDSAIEKKAGEITLEMTKALRLKGATRTDLMIDGAGTIYFIEVNTIPGMTETSLLPKAAEYSDISFDELVLRIASEALGND